MSSVEQAFRAAMRAAGLEIAEPIIADGVLHRVHVEGDKSGDKNAWYVLHANDVAAAAFGYWKRGLNETWCAKADDKLTDTERAELKRKWAKAKQQREAEREKLEAEAKTRARELWEKATEPPADHAYLVEKQVKSFGIRARLGTLLVPLRDAGGELVSLQFINGSGTKTFFQDIGAAGLFHLIGEPGAVLCVAEGYATGASIHEATGYPVAIAFNAGNLKAVAERLKRKYPSTEFVLCADNDQWTDGNPGVSKAREAAQAIGARLVIPEFSDLSSRPTDFNDLARLEGLEPVKRAIENAGVSEKIKSEKSLDQFYAYLQGGTYIYIPTCELWPAASVDNCVPWPEAGDKKLAPTKWLSWHRAVEQITWDPGSPQLVQGRAVHHGGWVRDARVSVFNLYRPPAVRAGDPNKAGVWPITSRSFIRMRPPTSRCGLPIAFNIQARRSITRLCSGAPKASARTLY